MKETNKKEIPLLSTEDIEVKVKQVTKTGALALLYKTARTDRKYLNIVLEKSCTVCVLWVSCRAQTVQDFLHG